MRVLVGYDGSESANAVIEDLRRGGLPPNVEAVVLCIETDYPMQVLAGLQAAEAEKQGAAAGLAKGLPTNLFDVAQEVAARGLHKLRLAFPNWQIECYGAVGSPYYKLLKMAEEWRPDLVAVGSHGRGLFSRAIFGSVSQFVVNHAACNVRVSRVPLFTPDTPPVLVIGLDGSGGSLDAVDAVAKRSWPEGTRIEVAIALDSKFQYLVPEYDYPISRWGQYSNSEMKTMLESLASRSVARLRAAKLEARYQVYEGEAASVLCGAAEKLQADCIFLGAKGHSAVEQIIMGSVSSEVAASARCSVEIVRPKDVGEL